MRAFFHALRRVARGRSLTFSSHPFVVLVDPASAADLRPIAKLDAALAVIGELHPTCYRRIEQDLSTFWIRKGKRAQYLLRQGICLLPLDLMLRSNRADLALVIVHEAIHARINKAGIVWRPRSESRIERACILAELRFAKRLAAAGWNVQELVKYLEERRESLKAGFEWGFRKRIIQRHAMEASL